MSTYKRLPIAIVRGEGNYLYDTEGKSYLDLFTGLAVSVLGHSHPAIVRALQQQGAAFLHISNIFLNTPAIQLARRLVEHSIPGKVFFTNSGAEATEAAIKLIHKWTVRDGGRRAGIAVLKNSFHGRTLGALRLTRQAHVYQDFPSPDIPVYELEANDLDQLRQLCRENRPAALLMEPVLGSGGIIPLSEEYLRQAEEICRQEGILLCMDEIQTGIGRTGELFAYQHAGITPDLILFAKGVGGGLPLGGIIGGEKLMNLFEPGDHGSTFAPSPLSAALGNAVLDVLLDAEFLQHVRDTAAYLQKSLQQLVELEPNLCQEIRGKGMMAGIVIHASPEAVRELQQGLLDEGILVDITQKTIIRLLPPLTITQQEIDRFVETFRRSLTNLGEKKGI
ncbi:acetylornithine transaminase [Brevibacillus humidisoli]|uniref:aspartate aminotransferase family protein n=1 Tax=Brevibacillus humidisoli TaxID=2895522 RepID=UPI001E2EFC71|nr:acetylornithine transaminase [Brevibacillus humidisoli]UFJ43220.1 acetylornithine transaminase [Brevibacillus humidisoli]